MSILTKIFGTINDTFSIGSSTTDKVTLINDAGVLKFSDKTRTNNIIGSQSDVDALELSSRQLSLNFGSSLTTSDSQAIWRTYQYSIELADIPSGFVIRYGEETNSTQYTGGTILAANTLLYVFANTIPSQAVITFTKR